MILNWSLAASGGAGDCGYDEISGGNMRVIQWSVLDPIELIKGFGIKKPERFTGPLWFFSVFAGSA